MKNPAYRKLYIQIKFGSTEKSIFYISRTIFFRKIWYRCKFERNLEQKSKFDIFFDDRTSTKQKLFLKKANFIMSDSELCVFIWKNIVRNAKFDCKQEHLHYLKKNILLNFYLLLSSGWSGHFFKFLRSFSAFPIPIYPVASFFLACTWPAFLLSSGFRGQFRA